MLTQSKVLKTQALISSSLTFILLILGLLLVSLQIKILGVEHYGLLVLILSLSSTINTLNFGFGSSLVIYYHNKKLFWKLLNILTLFFLSIGLIIIFIVALFSEEIYNLLGIDSYSNYLLISIIIISISRLIGSFITTIWIAKVDYTKVKLFGFFNTYISLIGIVLFFYFENDFEKAIIYSSIINFTLILITYIYLLIKNDMINRYIISIEKTQIKDFFSTSLQFQGITLINILIEPLIFILINKNFDLATITYFDLAFKMIKAGRQVIVSLVEPFFGKIVELNKKGKNILVNLLVKKYTKILIPISLIFIIGTFLLSEIVLSIWVGSDIALKSFYIANILSIGYASNILSSIIYYKLLAIKETRKLIFYSQLLVIIILLLSLLITFDHMINLIYVLTFAYCTSSVYLILISTRTQNEKK